MGLTFTLPPLTYSYKFFTLPHNITFLFQLFVQKFHLLVRMTCCCFYFSHFMLVLLSSSSTTPLVWVNNQYKSQHFVCFSFSLSNVRIYVLSYLSSSIELKRCRGERVYGKLDLQLVLTLKTICIILINMTTTEFCIYFFLIKPYSRSISFHFESGSTSSSILIYYYLNLFISPLRCVRVSIL